VGCFWQRAHSSPLEITFAIGHLQGPWVTASARYAIHRFRNVIVQGCCLHSHLGLWFMLKILVHHEGLAIFLMSVFPLGRWKFDSVDRCRFKWLATGPNSVGVGKPFWSKPLPFEINLIRFDRRRWHLFTSSLGSSFGRHRVVAMGNITMVTDNRLAFITSALEMTLSPPKCAKQKFQGSKMRLKQWNLPVFY
jgi:hypothetical protein